MTLCYLETESREKPVSKECCGYYSHSLDDNIEQILEVLGIATIVVEI